jgi:Caspase domain
MAKIALMIGISEYGSGLNSLPNTIKDIEAMEQVFQPLEKAGFDEVKCLANPNPPMMREAIETLFANRHKNDLVVLFFSGYLVQDNQGKLYLSTSVTCKTSKTELIRVSTIPATFVQDIINNSECQQAVLILDCCLEDMSLEETTQNNHHSLDLKTELGGEGRVILSCLNSNQQFSEQENIDINNSVYTSYLIEGMRTGLADLDNDGWIAVHELHQYASNKLKIAAPLLNPQIYSIEVGNKILLLPIPTEDPKLTYRKEVENWITWGQVSESASEKLADLAVSLELSIKDCNLLEEAALKPYRDYQDKLQRYTKEYKKAYTQTNSLDNQEYEQLNRLQNILGIKNEDIESIKEQIALTAKSASQQKSDSYSLQTNQENVSESITHIAEELVISPQLEATDSVLINHDNQIEQDDSNINLLSEQENELDVISEQANELNLLQSAQTNSSEATSQTIDELVISPQIEPTDSIFPNHNEKLVQDSLNKFNSPPLPPSIVVSDTPMNPGINLEPTETSPQSTNRFLIPLGIGGILTTIAVVIAFFHRTPVAPPLTSVVKETTVKNPASPSPIESPSPKPSISTAPESQICTVFVNGNLRSEPTYLKNNVIESLREPLSVTGKQTKGGWIEVRMPNDRLAWAYQDIIPAKARTEMNDCLNKKKTKLTIIEDLLPPNSTP